MKRNLIIAGSILLLIILVAWFYPSSDPGVPTAEVRKGNFSIYVIESGTVRAKNSSTVTAPRQASGNLQIVYLAPEGTIVKKDDILVRFDPSNALRNIEEKQNELKAVLADMDKLKAQQSADEAQAKTDFETAKLNFQLAEIARNRMQFEPEAKKREADLEFERAKLAFEQSKNNQDNKSIIRKSELNNLKLKIGQIRSNLEEVTKEMENLSVKAPISGLVVYESNWSTGRKIAVGDQPWRSMPLISLPDLSEAQIEMNINEMDIAKVKKGQSVLVNPDAFPDKQFKGVISSVSQIGREKASGSSVKVFDIVVDLLHTSDFMKPGITTTNKVVVETIKSVLYIPIVSVFEEENKTWVYVKNGSGFDKTEVKLGAKNDNFVVVKKGLNKGDAVALRNPEESPEEEKAKADEPKTVKAPSGSE